MASINNLKLKLVNHDHRRNTATVRVSYRVSLSQVERNMTGLRFRETIQLWGEDSPDADDKLYTFSTQIFSTERDGVVKRERTVTVGEDVLDEDGFPRPTDEVYAQVWVTPLLPSKGHRKSNIIEHRF
ncbi:MAG: hypothetical protein KAG19_03390 [Methylococcales bacterium]|nr:hypothetical protein [Methylococcales bacterium]